MNSTTQSNLPNGNQTVSANQQTKKSITEKFKMYFSKLNDMGLYPKAAKALFVFPFPLIIVTVYVALSMIFKIWHPLWIIFMTIPIYYRFAIACKANSKKLFALLLPVPEAVVTLYLILGVTTREWAYACLLYIIIPFYYWIAAIIKTKSK